MKTKSILLAGVTMMVLSTGAFAEDAKPMNDNMPKMKHEMHGDLNNDGVISKDEWNKRGDEMFAKMDTNKDGKISAEEKKAHRDAMRNKMKEKRKEMMEKRKDRMEKRDDMKNEHEGH